MHAEPLCHQHRDLSAEAAALAAELAARCGDEALDEARIRLYGALQDQEPQQIDLLVQTCHVIMAGKLT